MPEQQIWRAIKKIHLQVVAIREVSLSSVFLFYILFAFCSNKKG